METVIRVLLVILSFAWSCTFFQIATFCPLFQTFPYWTSCFTLKNVIIWKWNDANSFLFFLLPAHVSLSLNHRRILWSILWPFPTFAVFLFSHFLKTFSFCFVSEIFSNVISLFWFCGMSLTHVGVVEEGVVALTVCWVSHADLFFSAWGAELGLFVISSGSAFHCFSQ